MDKFETEVLTRLTIIETKLDDYKSIKEKTDISYNLSLNNQEEIKELKDKNKWLSRCITGAIITGIIALVFLIIQVGLGVK